MAKTAQIQEEKILLINNESDALVKIEQAETQLPEINALLAQYKALGFERQITNAQDVWDLIHGFDVFIQTERLKSIPETISGMKINRIDFLNKFVVKPEGLDELEAVAIKFPYNSMWFQLFKFNPTTGEFEMCSQSCDKIKEDHKQYARGRQIKLMQAADEFMEASAKLIALGIHPMSLLERDHWYAGNWYGYDQWRLKRKADFAFRVRAEEEV